MSRAVTSRLLLLVSLVGLLGVTVSGQSSTTKAVQKKTPAKTAPVAAPTETRAAAPADIKIRTKYTSGAQVSENTTYMKGERQRVEFPGVVSIVQGDLGQTVVINLAARTYFVTKQADVASAVAAASAAALSAEGPQAENPQPLPKPPRGGIVTYTTTLNDTGERKQVFGREARHITTTVTKSSSAAACDKTTLAVEADGWYIDFPAVARRPIAVAPPPAAGPRTDACVDQVESRTTGDAKLGFPIAMTTTTKIGEGDKQEVETSSMEVTAFEVTTLDAALFTVPDGYTEAKSPADLMASFRGGGSGLSDALVGSTADGTSTAAPKRAGAVRIGVLEPIDKSTHGLPTRELRQELAGNFRKAPYEALTLPGNSVADAQSEAARMECDYLLYSEITDIKTSKPGRVGGMLKKVSGDGPSRDVHEVKLDYRLYPVGTGAAAPVFTDSAKTSSGGGFDLRSAVHLAVFAGSMYMRFSGLGLLNPMLMSKFGGGLGPLASSGFFDPRMSAMSSMSQMFGRVGAEAVASNGLPAMPGSAATLNSEVEIRQTVDHALTAAARGTMEQLKKNNRK